MKFELDIDKTPFCTIGPYNFNYDEQKHDVDVDALEIEFKKQFLYNLRRGVLRTDAPDAVTKLADVPVGTQSYMPAAVVPITEADVTDSMENIIDKNLKVLKKILLGTIPSVKKEAATMRLGNLRKLVELEQEGKNRKKLITFFEQRLEAHTSEVVQAKGSDDLEANDMVLVNKLSTQLTDVVVSEEEEIAIPQEVLNQTKLGV